MTRIFLSPPDVGDFERRFLMDAFDSNWLAPLGPHVDAFEREFASVVGVPHAVALSSGTAALHLALWCSASAGRRGAGVHADVRRHRQRDHLRRRAPVFVDVSPATWTLDPDLLDEELSERAQRRRSRSARDRRRSLRPVRRLRAHRRRRASATACRSSRMPPRRWARHRSTAARARSAECAAFSFNGNKIITTSGGGMLVSHAPRRHRAGAPSRRRRRATGAALRALDDRLQLPPEQPARCGRPRRSCRRSNTRSHAAERSACATSAHLSPLGGLEFLAGGRLRPFEQLADLPDRRPRRVRRIRRTDPRAPGRERHRVAAGLETDAPSTGIPRLRACVAEPSPRGCSPPACACRAARACQLHNSEKSLLPLAAFPASVPATTPGKGRRVSEPSSRQATVLAWSRRPAIVALQLVCVALSNWLAFLLRFDWDVPPYAAEIFWRTLPWLVAVRGATFIAFRLDEGLWRYASVYDLRAIVEGGRHQLRGLRRDHAGAVRPARLPRFDRHRRRRHADALARRGAARAPDARRGLPRRPGQADPDLRRW